MPESRQWDPAWLVDPVVYLVVHGTTWQSVYVTLEGAKESVERYYRRERIVWTPLPEYTDGLPVYRADMQDRSGYRESTSRFIVAQRLQP